MGIFSSVAESFSKLSYISKNSSAFRYIPKHLDRHLGLEKLDNVRNVSGKKVLLRRLYGNTNESGGVHYFSILSTVNNGRDFKPEKNYFYLHHPRIEPPYPIDIVGAYDGIFCLEDNECTGKVILWNAATDELKFLPKSSIECPPSAAYIRFTCSGFGFDAKSEDYKVVRFVENVFENEDGTYNRTDQHFELYSLKTDSWRPIINPKMYPWSSPSTYTNGVYYWVANAHTRGYFILSFDFADEVFSPLPLPVTKPLGLYNFVLLDFEGLLGAIVYPRLGTRKTFDLWVWKDESWRKVCSFSLPDVEKPLGIWGRDKWFFEGVYRELLLFDLANGELKALDIQDYPDAMHLIPYVESTTPLNGHAKLEESLDESNTEVMYEKYSGRSKGFGFETMKTAEDAHTAAEKLNGTEVGGHEIKVNITEKPLPMRTSDLSLLQAEESQFVDSPYKVYVSNLAETVTTETLKNFFAEKGEVLSAKVSRVPGTSKSSGYGFVTFSSEEDVEAVISSLNDVVLEGQKIRVKRA